MGIIKLAQASGRPIYPSAIATSRRIVLNNWDRTTINLPFGRGAGVAAEPITVPRDADDTALEAARLLLEERLNAATHRAYEIVDGAGPRRLSLAKRLPLALRLYQLASVAGSPVAPQVLARRLKRGKEHPERLPERRGETELSGRRDR